MHLGDEQSIQLQRVSTNNLKSVDVSFPKGQLTVVTGKSGSGKSSLVFASLFAESERRYLESLSSFARQYIKAQAKPSIGEAHNLPAAIAIKQARALSNNRSTVGSLTELGSLLEVLYFQLSEVRCPSCSKTIKPHRTETAARKILHSFKKSDSIYILASLNHYKDLHQEALKHELQNLGYTRLWSNKSGLLRLRDLKEQDLSSMYVLIDRMSQEDLALDRVLESCQQAFRMGQDEVYVLGDGGDFVCYSKKRKCFDCGIEFMKPQPSLFSYNSSLGACNLCHGYGQSAHIDWDKVIPDKDSNLAGKGIAALSFGSHVEYYKEISRSAKKQGVDLKKPFKKYTKKEMQWLKEGDGENFTGMQGYFDWLESKKYKAHYRMHAAKFRLYQTCEQCSGQRYNDNAKLFYLNNKNIADVLELKISELVNWLAGIKEHWQKFTRGLKDPEDLDSAFSEVDSRLSYLQRIGVGYLSASRLSSTLSGGELQRIKMARCLGNYLTQTLFCLDEPTSGLHPKDTGRLLDIMMELKNQGNTVVVVEHEQKIIEAAEHLITIGPESGERGGELCFQGKPSGRMNLDFSWNEKQTKDFSRFFEITGASLHNLKNISVKFPVEGLIGVCGVSGSGKTTLVRHVLFPMLEQVIYGKESKELSHDLKFTQKIPKTIKDVFFVSQDPISRNSRSTIATYLGIYDDVRKAYAKTPEAQALKLTSKSFSFNSPGGRCEHCKGKGMVTEELSFLGAVDIVCDECGGKRFTETILGVRYKGYNIFELLSCTIRQMHQLFPESKKIKKVLDQVKAVGLDYITLGQSLSSFSGGEAQRLKLLSLSLLAKDDEKACLIFDEPTSGLSDEDIKVLLKHFQQLQSAGHTLIIIEHHTGLLKSCDWLIELGPGASNEGGRLLFQGPARDILEEKASVMASYLNS